jgi:hypothetical protein
MSTLPSGLAIPDSLLAKEATELDLLDDIAYGIGLFRRAVLFL